MTILKNSVIGRKSPGLGLRDKDEERPEKKKEEGSSSLLAFLTGETDVKPSLGRNRSKEKDEEDDILKPRARERGVKKVIIHTCTIAIDKFNVPLKSIEIVFSLHLFKTTYCRKEEENVLYIYIFVVVTKSP